MKTYKIPFTYTDTVDVKANSLSEAIYVFNDNPLQYVKNLTNGKFLVNSDETKKLNPIFLRVVEFVHTKGTSVYYGNESEWRKVGVTAEDSTYIKGYDFDREEFRTFLKSNILGGRIVEVK